MKKTAWHQIILYIAGRNVAIGALGYRRVHHPLWVGPPENRGQRMPLFSDTPAHRWLLLIEVALF